MICGTEAKLKKPELRNAIQRNTKVDRAKKQAREQTTSNKQASRQADWEPSKQASISQTKHTLASQKQRKIE